MESGRAGEHTGTEKRKPITTQTKSTFTHSSLSKMFVSYEIIQQLFCLADNVLFTAYFIGIDAGHFVHLNRSLGRP